MATTQIFAEGLSRKELKALRPRQILDAAFVEFTEKGYAAARLEDVARRVGVTKGTIYVYFPTKIDLFVAVARDYLKPILDRQIELEGPDANASAADLLKHYAELCYADLVCDPRAREFFRLMIAEGARVPEIVEFYVNEVMKYGVPQLQALLDHGVARGEFDAKVIAGLHEHPDMIFGPAVLISVMQLLMGDRHGIDLDRWRAAHIDFMLDGLRAR